MHQPAMRAGVCEHPGWLGSALEAVGSRAAVWVVPTDEEQIIADEMIEALAERQERLGE